MKKLISIILFATTLISCDIMGEEIGRLSFTETSNYELNVKELTLELKKGEKISFWTDTDIEYESDLALVYQLELWQDTGKIGGIQLNALETNPTLMQVKTQLGNKTSWSYQGKMNFFQIENTGKYTFKAIIKSSENPTLKLNKADLVFKK